MTAIVTVHPYAPFLKEVAKHPLVSGLRLNTAMAIKEPFENLLKRLQDLGKPLWVDLKARQLRTVGYWEPPYTEVKVSHPVSVRTPVTAYFGNGEEQVTLVAVDRDRLFFLDGPERVVGPGESINIVEPSLNIEGFLTETDLAYINAAKRIGLHNYMLSFVESSSDINTLLQYDPKATIVAKIESQKGLTYVRTAYTGEARLMAARGDLYIEVSRPHQILDALETIVKKDQHAIAASRIFPSLAKSAEPSCQDIMDVSCLLKMGYKTIMLGDELCMKKEAVLGALHLLDAIISRSEI